MKNENAYRRPPWDPFQALIVMFYEFHKYIRSSRVAGILALGGLIIGIILVVPPALGHPYPDDPAYFAQRFIAWVNVLVVVGAALFASDSLASEFQDRTGYLLFPHPVKRWVLFAGKMAASLTAMFLLIGAFYGVVAALTFWKYGEIPAGLMFCSGVLALMYALTATGVGFLVSSFMKGTTGALVLTAAILLLVLPIIDSVLSVAQVKPVLSPTFSSGAISLVMQTPYPVDTVVAPHMGEPVVSTVDLVPLRSYYPALRMSSAVMVGWGAVTSLAALILFGRREMAA